MSGARVVAPFTLTIDSREQNPYTFENIYANRSEGGGPVHVPTVRVALPNGDYSILGYPQVCVERKSKEDLYASVVRRANFESRLARMGELASGPTAGYAAVVVEAERMACIAGPPAFTRFSPRALSRTLIAWDLRFNVRWHFMRDRECAEVLVYRILERWWLDHQSEATT